MPKRPAIKDLFHFTDRRNLPSIRDLGGLYSYALLQEMGVEIPAPGGNEWSRDADAYKGMDRYVHLCFKANHPMEYRAREEGRIVSSVFLSVSTDVLKIDGVKFTSDVSNKAGIEAYSLAEAMDVIDFEMLDGGWKNYSDPEIQARLQAVEKYEVLVPDYIPLQMILSLRNG
jgi:ssDNA thymidine ADP-ribosyltransferase, DarT